LNGRIICTVGCIVHKNALSPADDTLSAYNVREKIKSPMKCRNVGGRCHGIPYGTLLLLNLEWVTITKQLGHNTQPMSQKSKPVPPKYEAASPTTQPKYEVGLLTTPPKYEEALLSFQPKI